MQRVFLYPLGMAALFGLAACVLPQGGAEPQTSGAADYAAFCAGCHGAGGVGDGEMAAGLAQKPADLTGLSARNGGLFPTTRVMAQIWGYTGGKEGDRVMPQFAALLDGALVPYDGGDGIETPTPVRLVELAEYLKVLQK
ncbi:cytochrome c [Rhodobacteraceae bacterium HSP-20]|uniref:Cytochrome c n=1 Tax=Paragemmobacter amnigenus TaxID=2852097 RepID=A0ABS6J396_9RHOB|nr:cytochrome c [Rhodobacter amnigenus]MBU9696912.1 cytochrome c [Rhodobacter amnigenus]MBV4388139.1 cytochrome c [Rhodobacter amnigenus]